MEPRLLSRGDGEPAGEDAFADVASMEPRLLSRGDKAAGCKRSEELARFNGAAASKPRRSRRSTRQENRGRCFNGAAASKPRRFGQVGGFEQLLKSLQWSRGF